MSYRLDRELADTCLQKQKDILAPVLGKYLLNMSSYHEDVKCASDLTVLRPQSLTQPHIGLRVRRPGYAAKFGVTQFTIRSERGSGVETELAKISRGCGGWFGYFHIGGNDQLCDWLVIDLDGFRLHHSGARPFRYDNRDGTYFNVYVLERFPVGILIAASDTVSAALSPLYSFAMSRRQAHQWDPAYGRLLRA